jgi:hypothetical protein
MPQDRGDAPLGVARVGVGEVALGEKDDLSQFCGPE